MPDICHPVASMCKVGLEKFGVEATDVRLNMWRTSCASQLAYSRGKPAAFITGSASRTKDALASFLTASLMQWDNV